MEWRSHIELVCSVCTPPNTTKGGPGLQAPYVFYLSSNMHVPGVFIVKICRIAVKLNTSVTNLDKLPPQGCNRTTEKRTFFLLLFRQRLETKTKDERDSSRTQETEYSTGTFVHISLKRYKF